LAIGGLNRLLPSFDDLHAVVASMTPQAFGGAFGQRA
jgi:hypothetical protein